MNKYNRTHKVLMPKITTHVCRHTFCSEKAKEGMNPKALQYLMGHSDIAVVLSFKQYNSFIFPLKNIFIHRLMINTIIRILYSLSQIELIAQMYHKTIPVYFPLYQNTSQLPLSLQYSFLYNSFKCICSKLNCFVIKSSILSPSPSKRFT